jgi:LCP family protein required for cell wall assembly
MNASGKVRLVFLAIVMSIPACNFPQMLPPIPTIAPTVTFPPTNTPFAPIPPTDTPAPTDTPFPTPTPTPTPVDPWENFPGPSLESATEIPRPVRTVIGSEDVVNIIVIGTDDAPGRTSMNSDVMVLVSIHPDEGTVSLVSFPRDLYVYLPGRNMARINTAYAYGGRDLLALTLLYNFGIEIDYYARVNFASFKEVVDTLGGIDVEVEQGFTDYCGQTYTYQSGRTYHMDGHTALCYVRMRKNSGGDFARHVRAQEVLLAIFHKVVSLEGLTRLPELYQEYSQVVETDMGLAEILPLVPVAVQVASDPTRIVRYTFVGMTSPWTTPAGGAVLLPNRVAILALLESALN